VIFFATKASSILFTVAISLLVLASNNGISLLLNHPTSSVFANSESTNNTLVVTHGIATGDVTNDSAVVWSRSNQESQMLLSSMLPVCQKIRLRNRKKA
jgi:phosphodiesterase/alkaline phosphatase D-like protein